MDVIETYAMGKFPHLRHSDEVLLDIGDAIHVDRTCEDHWCYGKYDVPSASDIFFFSSRFFFSFHLTVFFFFSGTNLRTGMSGIFPSAVVCEIDIVEEICMGALPSNANSTFYNDSQIPRNM